MGGGERLDHLGCQIQSHQEEGSLDRADGYYLGWLGLGSPHVVVVGGVEHPHVQCDMVVVVGCHGHTPGHAQDVCLVWML